MGEQIKSCHTLCSRCTTRHRLSFVGRMLHGRLSSSNICILLQFRKRKVFQDSKSRDQFAVANAEATSNNKSTVYSMQSRVWRYVTTVKTKDKHMLQWNSIRLPEGIKA